MPRYALNVLPWKISNSPGDSSHPASIEPNITACPPAAIAFTTSPVYLIPPSAIIVFPSSRATVAQS